MLSRPISFISRASTLALVLATAACSDDPATNDEKVTETLYAFVSQVETPDGSSTYLALEPAIPENELDLSDALEISGYGEATSFGDHVYVNDGENFRVLKHRVAGNSLEQLEGLSFKDRGLSWMGEQLFVDDEHAYMVNGDQFNIIEWNPSEMRIVQEHDISALQRDGWGSEYRGAFVRPSDGKLFIYWAYNNNREEFLNDFVLGVFDTKEKTFKVIEETSCPSSAGFGGFFDEAGDLYLIADSFGGFTYFGSEEPKDACILRIKDGEDELDADYRFAPTEALNGLAPWGFYYAGNGIAYTTAVDPAQLPDYESLFEFIFAPIHDGYSLDIGKQTASKVAGMPPDAVGFKSVTVDGTALIPRSTAAAEIYEVEDIQTTVYTLNEDGSEATKRFSMPGYLGNAIRLR
jgi:hypothetical protein